MLIEENVACCSDTCIWCGKWFTTCLRNHDLKLGCAYGENKEQKESVVKNTLGGGDQPSVLLKKRIKK